MDGSAKTSISVTRRWLLSGTAIGIGATLVPQAAGALVLEATAHGRGSDTAATPQGTTMVAGGAPLPSIILALAGSSPNTTYPPPLYIMNLPPEYQPGDTLRLFCAAGALTQTTGAPFADHLLTEADAAGGSISFGTTISSIASGTHTFQMQGLRGLTISPLGNIVIHGDIVAPSITSTTASGVANQRVLERLNFSEPVTAVAFAGLDGGALAALNVLPDTFANVVRADGANLSSGKKTAYSYTAALTDRSGNTSEPIARNNVMVIDQEGWPGIPLIVGITNSSEGQPLAPSAVAASRIGAIAQIPADLADGQIIKAGATPAERPVALVSGDRRIAPGGARQTGDHSTSLDIPDRNPALTPRYCIAAPSPLISFNSSDNHADIALSNANKTATRLANSGPNHVMVRTSEIALPTSYCFAISTRSSSDGVRLGLAVAAGVLTVQLGCQSDAGIWQSGSILKSNDPPGSIIADSEPSSIFNIFACQSTGAIWVYTEDGWAGGIDPGDGDATLQTSGFPVANLSTMVLEVSMQAIGDSITLVEPTISRASFIAVS